MQSRVALALDSMTMLQYPQNHQILTHYHLSHQTDALLELKPQWMTLESLACYM